MKSSKSRTFGLNDLIGFTRRNGSAIAIWRVPGKEPTGIMDFSSTEINDFELESSLPGFYFHPFSDKHESHFIKASHRFSIREGRIDFIGDPPPEPAQYETATPRSDRGNEPKIIPSPDKDNLHRNEFIDLVEKAKLAIKSGEFQKVVPSRRLKLVTAGTDFGETFESLCEKYPNAFISLTYIPSAGIWIGASPEILVHTRSSIFETVALAGTQAFREGESLKDVAWRQKEIEEQAYVSRYIINCFKKIRLREFDEYGPKTVIAGNLIHLKTTFRVDMEAVNFPQLGSVMLNLLHPTSAVCGMPRENAFQWLAEHEGYDRTYFSGYLGPVNMDGESTLYVNLRCMNFNDDYAWIYAGAGVTEDSVAEKEWEETSMKMNTLLDIIG